MEGGEVDKRLDNPRLLVVLAAVLVLAMATVFVACGGDSSSPTEPDWPESLASAGAGSAAAPDGGADGTTGDESGDNPLDNVDSDSADSPET